MTVLVYIQQRILVDFRQNYVFLNTMVVIWLVQISYECRSNVFHVICIQNVFYQIEFQYFEMHRTGEKPVKPKGRFCLQIQKPHIWTTEITDIRLTHLRLWKAPLLAATIADQVNQLTDVTKSDRHFNSW